MKYQIGAIVVGAVIIVFCICVTVITINLDSNELENHKITTITHTEDAHSILGLEQPAEKTVTVIKYKEVK